MNEENIMCINVMYAACDYRLQRAQQEPEIWCSRYWWYVLFICKHIYTDGYTFETRTTAGSVANLRLISDGYIDLAIVQADLLSDAYNATGAFTDKKYQKGYKAVASLYTEACQIVVRNDSGITSVDDLINKTVSVGASESGTEKNAEQILKMSGIADELINKVNMDYTEAAAKLKNGDIDAFFCTAGTRTGVIEQLSKECDISLISLDDKCIDKMLSAYSLCELIRARIQLLLLLVLRQF